MKPLLGGWVGNLQCKAQMQVKGYGNSFSCPLPPTLAIKTVRVEEVSLAQLVSFENEG